MTTATGPAGQPVQALRALGPYAVAAVAAATFFYNLGTGPLADWDEAIYAEVAREIWWSGDWVVMHWNYAVWIDKPPLSIWLTAIALKLFGVNEASARLVSALAGIGTVLSTYWLARRLRGELAGLLSALILLTCYQFVAGARFGTTDSLLTMFTTLTLLAYVLALDRPRWWYAVGLAAGLGIMTKGAGGLVGPAAVALAMVLDRRLPDLKRPEPWAGAILTLAVIAPWHLLAYWRSGPVFIDRYLGYTVLERASHPIEGHTGSYLTYVALMRNQFFPWIYLVPFAYAGQLLDLAAGRLRSAVMASLPLVVFTVYSLAQSKWTWYMLPLYPALAVLVAQLLSDALSERRLLGLAGCAVAVFLALVSVPNYLHRYPFALAVAFVALLAIGVGVAVATRRQIGLAVVPITVAFFAAVSLTYIDALYPAIRPAFVAPARSGIIPVAQAARVGEYGAEDPVGVVAGQTDLMLAGPIWPDVVYYSRRRMVVLKSDSDIDAFLADGRPHDALIARPDIPSLQDRYAVEPVLEAGDYAYCRISRARPAIKGA